MPYSCNNYKEEVRDYITTQFPNKEISILDIGPGSGTYAKLLQEYKNIDAVEVFAPYIKQFELDKIYRKIFIADILYFNLKTSYDLIILGDILEHLTIDEAQEVLENLLLKCKEIIVAVPYNYIQGEYEGNSFEEHKQDDLTIELMTERYPQLKLLVGDSTYGYYIKL